MEPFRSLSIKSKPPSDPRTLRKVCGGWWLRVILVLSFGLSQAEQKWTKMGV